MKKNCGILLLAAGHPHYGALAFQAALSFKSNDPTLPITLAYTPGALALLSETEKSIFDTAVDVSASLSSERGAGTDFIRLKTLLPFFSDYEQTLFSDADTLWLPRKPVRHYFERLKKYPFTAQCYTYFNLSKAKAGNSPYTFWAAPEAIAKFYGLKSGKLPQFSTTFILFRKDEPGLRFFDTVRELYDENPAPEHPLRQSFASGKPDEFYFNVAFALSGLPLLAPPFKPVYFHHVETDRSPQHIFPRFSALTTGGNRVPPGIAALYNRLLGEYARKAGIRPLFLHEDKKNWAPDRVLF